MLIKRMQPLRINEQVLRERKGEKESIAFSLFPKVLLNATIRECEKQVAAAVEEVLKCVSRIAFVNAKRT